jgi:hypothetical protein
MASGALSEGDEPRGEVDCESLSIHVRRFPHDSCEFLSWVRQEDGKSAGGLSGAGKCGLGSDWGFNDRAGTVLKVLAEFWFELCGCWEFAVGVAVDGDVLKGNSHLSFVRDKGKDETLPLIAMNLPKPTLPESKLDQTLPNMASSARLPILMTR